VGDVPSVETLPSVSDVLASGAPSAEIIPLEDRMFMVSKTYEAIALYFAHWEDSSFGPEELDQVYRGFLKRAIETESRKDFVLLMMEFVGLLNNGHSGFGIGKCSKTRCRADLQWCIWTLSGYV
jgi:hypothetical protein